MSQLDNIKNLAFEKSEKFKGLSEKAQGKGMPATAANLERKSSDYKYVGQSTGVQKKWQEMYNRIRVEREIKNAKAEELKKKVKGLALAGGAIAATGGAAALVLKNKKEKVMNKEAMIIMSVPVYESNTGIYKMDDEFKDKLKDAHSSTKQKLKDYSKFMAFPTIMGGLVGGTSRSEFIKRTPKTLIKHTLQGALPGAAIGAGVAALVRHSRNKDINEARGFQISSEGRHTRQDARKGMLENMEGAIDFMKGKSTDYPKGIVFHKR
jgi:hypothetical protein